MALHGEEAYERKLRPLYDALDARSYKQAVKLADVVLKKYKNDQLARALKGYALYHTGKHQEALQLMRDIVAEGPEAERVVMTMSYTYKAAGQLEAISQAYAAAAEKHPRDTDILAGLFKSYVREFNFVKQQQVAMKLSKLVASSPDNKCGWWIVCSLALQARAALLHQDQHGNPLAAGGGLAPDKLLQLAETMAARQAAAAVQHAPAQPQQAQPQVAVGLSYEALLLYLDILQGQGKAQQALEVVEGPLGGAVPLPADRLQLRAAALVRAGDLPAAAACYRQAVQAAPDDWLSWQLYLDCLLPGSSGGPSGSRFPVGVVGGLADIWDRRMQQQQQQQQPAGGGIGDDAAAALAAAKESMRQLSAEVAPSDSWRAQLDNGVLRAPHLWRCELLLRRQRLAGAADGHTDTVPASEEQQQELAAAVGEAFPMLAANFSCVSDLRAYLATLSGTAAEQLATAVHRQAAELNAQDAANSSAGVGGSTGNSSAAANGGGGGGVSGEVRRLQRLVNAHQIEQELGLPRFAAPDEAVAHARCLLDLYRRHMHLSAGLDEKERGYGEELVAGAVESLMAAAVLETAAAAPAQAAGPGAAPPPERALARMVQAVLVLEAAQQRRKVSAPLRLAATALYSLLGAPKLAAAQFAALDIKSILHDSMTGHWMLPLLPGGATAAAYLRCWVDGCTLLHSSQQGDAGDALGTALEHGTYSKVAEFVDFKERLQHSHTRALAAVARTLLAEHTSSSSTGSKAGAGAGGTASQRTGLLHAAQLLAAAAEREVAAGEGRGGAVGGALVRFNEDLSTRPSWYPPGSAAGSAVGDWWQAAAQGQPPPGYARCWWSRPLAAQAASPSGAAWRRRCLAELRVMVALALVTSASLGNAEDAAALLEQLQPLLQQPVAAAHQQQQQLAGASLQAASCGAVLAVLQALGGAAPADVASVQQLAQACSAAARRASAELAAVRDLPVLPGYATSAAAAVMADCRGIAAVCSRLQKLAAAATGQEAMVAATGKAVDAATDAASTVKQAAAAELEAADSEQRVEQVLRLLDSCSGGDGDGDALWGFEPVLEAQAVVAALVQAQAAMLQSMQE